ncbi:High-affinity branched-chain amino acid transport system permease protein LivH [Aquimixticola soesokkakensis]|uniref:High-affinity branched-chain amino acid transport system permease protein LivH n=2 Tax=Aquimixticola soesokkakensis TaxID=1519096 RepID=A0A1Y5SYK4_9RHOB|nr:High-affinity branched-chain amino acid transport system permease protein LivH [Aquimixticola soesokkakensis]
MIFKTSGRLAALLCALALAHGTAALAQDGAPTQTETPPQASEAPGEAPGATASAAMPALSPIQSLLQANRDLIEAASRRTIQPAIDALATSGLPQAQSVLEKWQAREMWQRDSDGLFFYAEEVDRDTLRIFDFSTGEPLGDMPEDDFTQLKPNSGIRGLMGAALVSFQLNSDDPAVRGAALAGIERDGDASHLAPLRSVLDKDMDAANRARAERLERLLTVRFGESDAERVEAIGYFNGDLGVDARAALNPLVATTLRVGTTLPEGGNVARTLKVGSDALPRLEAYALLVDNDLAPPLLTVADNRAALEANIVDGQVGGIAVADLDSDETRARAYAALAAEGTVPLAATPDEIDTILDGFTFYETFAEPSALVTDAASDALTGIGTKVGFNQFLDLSLDGLSLASIYFLAAIGLAITFGVMGVINMAHGEFIMMGAYTGYVVQQIIPDYTLSLIVAIPAAFAVTFAAGVAMERLIIRWLYNRPLETLLSTFGVSIALQQLAKNIFGTQARPLTSPSWLDGSFQLNDVVGISYIRIAIFVLALIFLGIFLFIMKKTRLGLETRAVTQNPRMAASMGINPDRVNMLTFGLGSGIAGIAGVAIGLYAKVTSELGADYIVQSFMTVVVGGVGNIWGTLLGATMIGFLQKGIEWFNPANTLAAQTYMIIFIIIFIQFRPRGIIALKGRAAGD